MALIPLHKLLPEAEGSDLIRKCWGDVPCFDGDCSIVLLQHEASSNGDQEILLTCLSITSESEDENQCKPSKMRVRFSGVTHWEYDYNCAGTDVLELADIFNFPPPDLISIDVQRSLYLVCRQVTVLSCDRQPFLENK